MQRGASNGSWRHMLEARASTWPSPPLHSKLTVQHIVERKQLIDTLYRRGSQGANDFKASIILYVLQFIVVVFD